MLNCGSLSLCLPSCTDEVGAVLAVGINESTSMGFPLEKCGSQWKKGAHALEKI